VKISTQPQLSANIITRPRKRKRIA